MAWTIWSLATRPEIQASWAEEASEVLGEQPYATEYDTVEPFRYGEGVLRESMRLKPVAPITGVEPLADTEGGRRPDPRRHPPARSCTATPAAATSSEPTQFRPERWLEDDELEAPTRNRSWPSAPARASAPAATSPSSRRRRRWR